MHKIEKQILFEIKQELNESVLDRAVGAVTDSIPGQVVGKAKDMVFRDPKKNQAPDLEQQELLQKRFEPFQYPVSLMIGKFNIYKKEAEEAAEAVDGEDPKNQAQLKRKAEIYEKITDKILTPLSEYIDKAAKQSNFTAFNTLTTTLFNSGDGTIHKAITDINSNYGLSIPPVRLPKEASATETDPTGAAAKLGTEYDPKGKYTEKGATLQEERDIENEKAYLDLIIKQLRELLRPLALLVQKKGKESRTKITQTDLVQALDAKGIKENRNEIIRLIVELSQAKGGDFDIQEFLKDPIGQSKKWLETPVTESNGNDTAKTKKNLALKIAMAYYSKKLEPIIDKLPQDIAKDSAKLTTIKQKLAKAFITGSSTETPLEIELTAESGTNPAETVEFNWTGTTFERKIKGWERFLKAKGMEGFSHIEKFAKLANEVIGEDNYENFMKKPEATMRSMATAQMSHQSVYTNSPFTGDTFARAELFENEADPDRNKEILKLAYYIAVHKYGKKLKPILLQMEDNDIDTNNFKDIVAPWVLLSYLRKDFKRFNIEINEKTTLKFEYNKAGNIMISGLRNLTDEEKRMVDLIKGESRTFVALFGLKYQFEGTQDKAEQLGLKNLTFKKGIIIPNQDNKPKAKVNQKLQELLYDEEGEPTLSFARKKDSKAPIDYLYNVYKLFTGKNAEAHKNFINSKTAVEKLITNSNEQDDIFRDLRELFDWYQDKEALDNSDFGKIGKFINKELRELIKNSQPEEQQEEPQQTEPSTEVLNAVVDIVSGDDAPSDNISSSEEAVEVIQNSTNDTNEEIVQNIEANQEEITTTVVNNTNIPPQEASQAVKDAIEAIKQAMLGEEADDGSQKFISLLDSMTNSLEGKNDDETISFAQFLNEYTGNTINESNQPTQQEIVAALGQDGFDSFVKKFSQPMAVGKARELLGKLKQLVQRVKEKREGPGETERLKIGDKYKYVGKTDFGTPSENEIRIIAGQYNDGRYYFKDLEGYEHKIGNQLSTKEEILNPELWQKIEDSEEPPAKPEHEQKIQQAVEEKVEEQEIDLQNSTPQQDQTIVIDATEEVIGNKGVSPKAKETLKQMAEEELEKLKEEGSETELDSILREIEEKFKGPPNWHLGVIDDYRQDTKDSLGGKLQSHLVKLAYDEFSTLVNEMYDSHNGEDYDKEIVETNLPKIKKIQQEFKKFDETFKEKAELIIPPLWDEEYLVIHNEDEVETIASTQMSWSFKNQITAIFIPGIKSLDDSFETIKAKVKTAV